MPDWEVASFCILTHRLERKKILPEAPSEGDSATSLIAKSDAMKSVGFLLLFVCACAFLSAQSNPVPFIDLPLVPASTAPGGSGFTLTVNGAGFVSGATVNWNGHPLTTQFVSKTQLTADVLSIDIAIGGTATVTVSNSGAVRTSSNAPDDRCQ